MPRSALQTAVILLVTTLSPAGRALAQSGFPALDEAEAPPALVRSVEVVATPEGPALEIIATRPLVPQITKLAAPPRLVIDLPKAYLSSRQKVTFRDAEPAPTDTSCQIEFSSFFYPNLDYLATEMGIKSATVDSPETRA